MSSKKPMSLEKRFKIRPTKKVKCMINNELNQKLQIPTNRVSIKK